MSTATKAKVTVILAKFETPDAPAASAGAYFWISSYLIRGVIDLSRFGGLFFVCYFAVFVHRPWRFVLMKWCGVMTRQCGRILLTQVAALQQQLIFAIP
jgi:hypothetical protein